MGMTYLVYTEVKVKGTWYTADCMVRRLKKGYRHHEDFVLNTTYWNGSRSYFGDTYDKLRDLGYPVKIDDLSDDLKNYFLHSDSEEISEESLRDYYNNYTIAVSFSALKDALPDEENKSKHGIYHKDRIYLFESGELEDLYEDDIEPEEYSKLAPEAQKVYQYYEWDDPMSWPGYFREIISRVNTRLRDFRDANYLWNEEVEDVRLIVVAS